MEQLARAEALARDTAPDGGLGPALAPWAVQACERVASGDLSAAARAAPAAVLLSALVLGEPRRVQVRRRRGARPLSVGGGAGACGERLPHGGR